MKTIPKKKKCKKAKWLRRTYKQLPLQGLPCSSVGKESACNAGDLGSISRWARSPGEGSGNPLQYSCLENPMDGGAWEAAVHGVTKSPTQLSDFTFLSLFQYCCLGNPTDRGAWWATVHGVTGSEVTEELGIQVQETWLLGTICLGKKIVSLKTYFPIISFH